MFPGETDRRLALEGGREGRGGCAHDRSFGPRVRCLRPSQHAARVQPCGRRRPRFVKRTLRQPPHSFTALPHTSWAGPKLSCFSPPCKTCKTECPLGFLPRNGIIRGET